MESLFPTNASGTNSGMRRLRTPIAKQILVPELTDQLRKPDIEQRTQALHLSVVPLRRHNAEVPVHDRHLAHPDRLGNVLFPQPLLTPGLADILAEGSRLRIAGCALRQHKRPRKHIC